MGYHSNSRPFVNHPIFDHLKSGNWSFKVQSLQQIFSWFIVWQIEILKYFLTISGRTGKPRKARNNDESSSEEDDTNSVTIDEEDESENVNKKEVKAQAPVADIEDTVGDIDMRTKKMEALDKTK